MATPAKVVFTENTMIHSVDERKGCRSLLCDASGIIIAEMVYRCMICYSIHDFIGDVSTHYHTVHMNDGDEEDVTIEEDQNQLNRTTTSNNNSNTNPMALDNKKNHHFHNQNNSTIINTSNHHNNIDSNNNYLSDHSNNFDDSWETDEKFKPNSHSSIGNHVKLNNQSNISDTYTNSQNSSESCTRSGIINCPVCSSVRYYTTLQRRYGQFTCVACYRFFKEFFTSPSRYSCPSLGQCSLDVKSKCRACWILACIKTYTVDERRKNVLATYAPTKENPNEIRSPKSSPCSSVIINHSTDNNKPSKSNSSSSLVNSKNVNDETITKTLTTKTRSSIQSDVKESSNIGNDFSHIQSTSGSENTNQTISSSSAVSTNNNTGDGDSYSNTELASLSALNMLNILHCEEGVPDCDELMEELADDYNSIDSQLDEYPPQKMLKLNDSPNDEHNPIPKGFPNELDEKPSSLMQSNINNQLNTTMEIPTESTTTTMTSTPFLSAKIFVPNETNLVPTITGTPTSVIKSKPDRRSKVRVKNWSCLKCANCLADDCGKCINCLDRPKFGGPFVRKQRCVNKKCLEKIQPDQPK